MPIQKIAIVGSGAVGMYYGGRLAAIGKEVHFLLRSDYEAVRKNGIRLVLPDGEIGIRSARAHQSTESIGPADLVIVALKTTANDALPKLMPPLLGKSTAIITLQNGLGNERFLAEHFGADRVMGGLCFICLNRTAPGCVRNFFPGTLTIGEYTGPPTARTRELAEAFQEAGVDCRLAENLLETRWRKLVWNVPFNGLTIAAGGIDTEKVLADDALREEVRELMREVRQIAKARGVVIEDAFLEKQIEITRPMGPYRPSSLIDFLEKRPVEVESIWGEPLREAQRCGVPTPRLRLLYALLKSLQGISTPGRGRKDEL